MSSPTNDQGGRRLNSRPSRVVKRVGKDPGVPSPALFDLATAKAKVSKVVEETAPGQFKHFYASPLFDRMVTSCLIYVIDNLQLTTLGQAVDKAQRQHLDNLRPEATEERQKELSKGANQALHALAPIYSLVILQHSTYKQTHQDQLFFEAVYSALAALIHEALGSFKTRQQIDVEVGDLFRTRAFNFHARKAAPPRSLDTLTLRELYALKTENSNRALSARVLADIYKRLESIHVQSTCRINTPLITQCLQSPIVGRNAQLAKQHAPAAKLDATAKPGEKLGGTLKRSGAAKPDGKEKSSGVGGGALSAIPVWVDSNGMATDDSIVQLDTLRDILMGKRIHKTSSGTLRSEKSMSSMSGRPSLAGTGQGAGSVLGMAH
ncbi:hypothetical protein WJX77_005666 [Trebouxia sp. C0004]